MSHTVLLGAADETTTAFLADQLGAGGYQPAIARTLETVYELAEALVPEAIVLGDLAERRFALALLDDIRAGARPFDATAPCSCSAATPRAWTCCAPSTMAPTTS